MNVKPLVILLGDDDIDDCMFFSEALKDFFISTHLITVHDGEQVMEQLTKEKHILPDVLFMDINMPRKNGRECLLEIKLSEEFKLLPVVMFSTSYEQEVVNLLFDNGANYFMRKPVDFSQFRNLIQHAITLIVQGNFTRPLRENFVLKVQSSLGV